MDLPSRIGKYELQEFLGGGMSHVYRARDTVIERTVAVKILTESGCQDPEVKARFLAEARMAGNLTHDNVLSIYDFGEDEQHRPFMVMEFLKGEDLRHAIRDGHTGDLAGKLKIAIQVARALEFIHGQKIIHRDIKPENIHINGTGVVKLMDFGIAKSAGLDLTRAGFVLGTVPYMAPEQVMGQQLTEQVDVYAFGVLLFEMFTGIKPIDGDSVERIFFSILNEPLNLEPLRVAGAPQSVCDLVARCTAKDPAQRPQGFAPIRAELERFLAETQAPTIVIEKPQPPPPPPPPSPMKWLVPAILVLVAALGAGVYFATRPKPQPVAVTTEPPKPQLPATLANPAGDMVLVSAGPFLFGENKDSKPLQAFYIDRTEVTNQAYAAFCGQTHHPLPEHFAADHPDYPVVNVSILDAKAFATWAGKRLPNAREWEKAARGPDGRLFPWGGDQPDPSKANLGHPEATGPGPVTAYPEGASPYGALNLFGNVWELIEELGTPSAETLKYYRATLHYAGRADEAWYQQRGGAFNFPWDKLQIWDFSLVPAGWKGTAIGFRCVKDAP